MKSTKWAGGGEDDEGTGATGEAEWTHREPGRRGETGCTLHGPLNGGDRGSGFRLDRHRSQSVIHAQHDVGVFRPKTCNRKLIPVLSLGGSARVLSHNPHIGAPEGRPIDAHGELPETSGSTNCDLLFGAVHTEPQNGRRNSAEPTLGPRRSIGHREPRGPWPGRLPPGDWPSRSSSPRLLKLPCEEVRQTPSPGATEPVLVERSALRQ
jgi:hypothetical protein